MKDLYHPRVSTDQPRWRLSRKGLAAALAAACLVAPAAAPAAGPRDEQIVGGVRQSLDKYSSGGRDIRIERYLPAGGKRHPAVLFLHGGGGVGAGAGDPVRVLARNFARRGYVVTIPHFFDQNGIRWADHDTIDREFVTWMHTVNAAITYTRGLPEVDPDRVGLLGWSLGASLGLEVSATFPHVAAVVGNCGGMAWFVVDRMKSMPPTLLLDGGNDPNYPAHLARKLAQRLREKGVEVESVIYPGQGHGFSGDAAIDAGRRTTVWFDKHLRLTAADAP
jgi:carboxymethylenebutenolidase